LHRLSTRSTESRKRDLQSHTSREPGIQEPGKQDKLNQPAQQHPVILLHQSGKKEHIPTDQFWEAFAPDSYQT